MIFGRLLSKPSGLAALVAVLMVLGILLNVVSDQVLAWALMERSRQNDAVNQFEPAPVVTNAHGAPVQAVMRGKSFFVHYIDHRTQACWFTTTTNMFEIGGIMAAASLRLNETWYPAGRYEVSEMYTIPVDVPAGTYKIVKKSVNHCGNAIFFSNNFEVIIKVTEP